MGHRALVAYRRSDHLYDLRYSHWGGDDAFIGDAITATDPLADGRVDATVLADTIALQRLLREFLDPRVFETLYLVTPTYDVTPYRVWWLGWSDGDRTCRGAIVETNRGSTDVEHRSWFLATKAVLADTIEMGVLSRRAAQAYLEARICEEQGGYVYTYGNEEDVAEPPADGSDWPPPDGVTERSSSPRRS